MDLSVSLLPVIKLFKWSGVWFPKQRDSRKYFAYRIYSCFMIAVLFVAYISFQGMNIFFLEDNIPAVAETFCFLFVQLAEMVKIYTLVKNMDVAQNLVYKTLNQESFQPTYQRHLKIFESTMGLWKKAFQSFMICVRITVFLLSLYPILDNSSDEKRFPLNAWYPYNSKTSPNYEITFVHQIFSTLYIAQLNVASDTFVSGLFSHIGIQCDLLCDRLEHMEDISRDDLQRRNRDSCSEENVIKNMHNVLRKCIKHHKDILVFSKDVENLINMGVFAQFFASVGIMCMTMLRLTFVESMSAEFYAIVFYQACILVQVLMYCWFGNEVIFKSLKIPGALSECNWVDNTPSFKKDLLFFMYRTQTPLRIYTINFFVLSMATFIAIIRSAYSYYAVLRQVNES